MIREMRLSHSFTTSEMVRFYGTLKKKRNEKKLSKLRHYSKGPDSGREDIQTDHVGA